MIKKELILSFLVIGLSILFVGISLAVFLTKGKSKKWIAHKMKIGALLLTLSAVSCGSGEEEVMCYSTVAINSMWMQTNAQNEIEINLDTNNVLKGGVYESYNSEYSFSVLDADEKKMQSGNLIPEDGKFDQTDEDFKIELDKNLKAGNYKLNLYTTGVNGQDTLVPISNFNLVIKE